jgi:hypothetical protein
MYQQYHIEEIGEDLVLMSPGNITESLRLLPVIKGYYLVLGGGKIGTNFMEHARKHSLPFVLVIDNKKNAPASSGTELIKDTSALHQSSLKID